VKGLEEKEGERRKKQLEEQEDRLSYMDEELHFIMENFEFSPEFSDELVNDYFYNRKGFFFLMLVQYLLQIYLILITLNSQNFIILRFN